MHKHYGSFLTHCIWYLTPSPTKRRTHLSLLVVGGWTNILVHHLWHPHHQGVCLSQLLVLLAHWWPWHFYCNIFCILFDIKDSIFFCILRVMQGVYMCTCVGHLYLSTWDVTKHGDWSPSLIGINWVSDRVSIDSSEYMHCKSVHFSGSLEEVTVVDFWGRNGMIPVGTKLLLLSNRLQGFWWGRTILD